MTEGESRARAASVLRPMSYEKFVQRAGESKRALRRRAARRMLGTFTGALVSCAITAVLLLVWLLADGGPTKRELLVVAIACATVPVVVTLVAARRSRRARGYGL